MCAILRDNLLITGLGRLLFFQVRLNCSLRWLGLDLLRLHKLVRIAFREKLFGYSLRAEHFLLYNELARAVLLLLTYFRVQPHFGWRYLALKGRLAVHL